MDRGDSGSATGWDVRVTALVKVFRTQDFLIGYTSSFRMGQILEYHLEVPQQKEAGDLRYLVSKFIPCVRACLKEYWFSTLGDKDDQGGTFLLGYRGHLYAVHADFQVNESSDGIDACGSGKGYALGAMRALGHLPPKERIRGALAISAYFSRVICAPFCILYTG